MTRVKVFSVEMLSLVCFMGILGDSLISYYSKVFGVFFPSNAAVVLVYFFVVLLNLSKPGKFFPSGITLGMLGLLVIGFAFGFTNDYFPTVDRLNRILSALAAFSIGYATLYNSTSDQLIGKAFLLIGLVYVFVCTVALLKLFPPLFPIIETLGYLNWNEIRRPEVTTDQNFQIYYLFFVAAPIIMLKGNGYKLLSIILMLGAVFVLAKLQTRSGLILMALTAGIFLFLAVQRKVISNIYLFLLGAVCVLVSFIYVEQIAASFSNIISRFVDDDYHNLHGRVHSFTYLFKNLVNVNFWFPRGLETFTVSHGGSLPHSNYTAVYLEGGLLSLIGIVGLQLIPLLKYMRHFFNSRIPSRTVSVYVIASISLAVSLSLCAPYFEQVYLWTGALCGGFSALNRKTRRNNENIARAL